MRLYLSAKTKTGYTPDWIRIKYSDDNTNEKVELTMDIQGEIEYNPETLNVRVKGELVPGLYYTDTNETLSSAVKRTLEEKTPLKTLTYHLQELPARTNPERDERGHVVSIPILVLLPDYQKFNDDWSTFTPNMDLAFDHAEMVNLAYKVLKNNWDKHPLPLLLAGEKTTLEEAKDILVHFQPYYSKVLPSNLRQMTFVDKFLQETDESEKNEQKGRPKKLYRVKTEQINPLYT